MKVKALTTIYVEREDERDQFDEDEIYEVAWVDADTSIVSIIGEEGKKAGDSITCKIHFEIFNTFFKIFND